MQKPLNTNLPANLPEDWATGQAVTPTGTDAGLTERHGYNYQSKQVNDAHKAINELNNAFANAQDNLEVLAEDTAIADAHSIPVVQTGSVKKRITFANLVAAIRTKFTTVFAALSHTHGNVTNDGKIGTAANQAVYTGSDGKMIVGVLPTAAGGTGNVNGTVAKLTTPRNIQVNLSSGAAASFDGSANVTPGVSGILPTTMGGTGASTPEAARSNLGINLTNLGAAPASHNHNASNINAGTLSEDRLPTIPVSKGGTGVTNLNVNKLKRDTNSDTIIDIYLSPSGNDSATGLTASVPMKTIRAAVGRYGGLNRIRLNLAAGTYADTSRVEISGNTYVDITGTPTTAGSVVITHALVFQSTDAKFNRVTFDLSGVSETYPAITLRQSKYDIQNCVFKGKATVNAGINVSLGSSGYIVDCTFQTGVRAVEIGSGASMTALTCSIAAGFEIGFNVNGGTLISGGNTNNATTKFTMYNSAVIFNDGGSLNTPATIAAASVE